MQNFTPTCLQKILFCRHPWRTEYSWSKEPRNPNDGFLAFKTLLFRTLRFSITKYTRRRILIFKDAANSQDIAYMKKLFRFMLHRLHLFDYWHFSFGYVFAGSGRVRKPRKTLCRLTNNSTFAVRFVLLMHLLQEHVVRKRKTHDAILWWILMCWVVFEGFTK